MAAPKSGFEAWLRSTMADMRQQWEVAAYGRPVTGELVYPVTGTGQDRASDPQPLQNKGHSGSGIEAPEIGLEAKDGKVPPFHMTDDRGLEEFKATRASLEPQKQEARFSDLYGSEHYPETAPHVQADAQAHQAWTKGQSSPLMDDLRQAQSDVWKGRANLGVDTSGSNSQPRGAGGNAEITVDLMGGLGREAKATELKEARIEQVYGRGSSGKGQTTISADTLNERERARFEQMKDELQTQSRGMQGIDHDRSIDR